MQFLDVVEALFEVVLVGVGQSAIQSCAILLRYLNDIALANGLVNIAMQVLKELLLVLQTYLLLFAEITSHHLASVLLFPGEVRPGFQVYCALCHGR